MNTVTSDTFHANGAQPPLCRPDGLLLPHSCRAGEPPLSTKKLQISKTFFPPRSSSVPPIECIYWVHSPYRQSCPHRHIPHTAHSGHEVGNVPVQYSRRAKRGPRQSFNTCGWLRRCPSFLFKAPNVGLGMGRTGDCPWSRRVMQGPSQD